MTIVATSFSARLYLCVALLLVTSVSATGCVAQQHRAYVEARRAYDECLAANGNDLATCRTERDIANQRYSQHERDAKRAWGCEIADDCSVGPDSRHE